MKPAFGSRFKNVLLKKFPSTAYVLKEYLESIFFKKRHGNTKNVPEIEIYFDTFIAPELVSHKHKPAYI